MDSEIMVEMLPLLGLCNLCLNEGAVKSMLVSQKHDGIDELYSDMLFNCFSIDMSTLEMGDTKKLICEACISRLRDSMQFKDLCERSLKILIQNAKTLELEKATALNNVKKEVALHQDDYDGFDNFDDEDDNITLNEIKVKEEPKDENAKIKRSRKTMISKKILKSLKKKSDNIEIESLLSNGLFPFKIRKNGAYSCYLCSVKSTELDEIKDHVTGHSKSNLRIAFHKMFFSNSQRFYQVNTKMRCKICTTDVSDFNELKSHLENCSQLNYSKNWNKLPFKLEKDQLDCPVCKKTFLNYVSLNTHMNIHYPNYICENCGKAFASKARLRGHMRTHEVGTFPCRHCNAVFDRVTKRENHVSKEHKSGVRYACKRCNISLTSFYARQKHLAEVHNEELKRYKCKVCPQSYITPGHLSSHVRRDHLNERNHKCDKCDLAFYTKNALKMHMIKHDGERIHKCHICQKSYQRKKTLREHMRIHTNDKRFVCPVCGRAFTQKCTLKGHLKVHDRKVDIDDRLIG